MRFRRGRPGSEPPPPVAQSVHVTVVGSPASQADQPAEVRSPTAVPSPPPAGAADPPVPSAVAPPDEGDAIGAPAVPAVEQPGAPEGLDVDPVPVGGGPERAEPEPLAVPEGAVVLSPLPVAPFEVPPAGEPPAAEPRRRRFRRRQRRAQHRRSRPRRRVVLAVLAVIIVLLGAFAIVAAVRVHRHLPLATVDVRVPPDRVVAGTAPTISWPAGVQSALAIPSIGVTEQSGPEVPAPIASVTKMMTAHIVLTDHPLAAGDAGPSITITPNDVELYNEDVATDQANIQVAVGEVLTEQQLLEGMLVHSANNFADLLAIFDAGNISAFVTKMNATAAALGMTQTTYADASGLSTATVSTPADQLKVATQDVENPVFDQIVDMTAVTLPVAGTVGAYTPLLGTDGVVGVKSGFTSAAGGCDVLGLLGGFDGAPVEVLAAVVGEHVGSNVILAAGLDALSVARPAMSNVRIVHLFSRGQRVGTASDSGYSVPVVTKAAVSVIAWPGQRATESFHLTQRPRSGAGRGTEVGTITVTLGPQKFQVAVGTSTRLSTPTFWQRVF